MDSDDNIEEFLDEEGYLSDDQDGGQNVWEGQRKGRVYQMGHFFFHREKKSTTTAREYFHCAEKTSHNR